MAKKKHKARKSTPVKSKGTQVVAETLGPDCIAYNVKPEEVQFVAERMSQILHRHYQVVLMRLEGYNSDE